MKRIILSILVAAICTAGHAQSITGSWKGSPAKESQNGIESIDVWSNSTSIQAEIDKKKDLLFQALVKKVNNSR